MGKLVILKLGGKIEQGFSVTLQIGEEGERPTSEINGKLPPATELLLLYGQWQAAYRRLDLRPRLEAPAAQVTNVSVLENCTNAAGKLLEHLNIWLNSESFRPVREKWLEKLTPQDEVRIILQTEDQRLQRLPWHLWDLIERYPKAELALGAPVYEQLQRPSATTEQATILAILGNSIGINTQADRTLLEQLPQAKLHFLVEPQRQDLTDQLWATDGWDILFFAGHSSSLANGDGCIAINPTEHLTIAQLKYGLKKAVERGLKIAIFNSCDGLGLAQALAELQIPQLIVMREPVPDRVAQAFLKYFLAAFADGQPFYLAVREARERLQGMEDQFPCATWLPIIYQNPAEAPPTWQSLCSAPAKPQLRPPKPELKWRTALLISLGITAVLLGLRHGGWLQSLELKTFDQLIQLRPDEAPDARLLVVTITEADVQAQNPDQRRGSLSDQTLDRLLQKIEQYQPRAIGLDVYRDFPVADKMTKLAYRLERNPHFIAVCKVSDSDSSNPGVPPPPEVPSERLGFSDVVVDDDGILRRHLLTLTPDPASPCTTPYAFSTQLAFRYLAVEGKLPQFTPEGNLQLGNTVLKRLRPHQGGYQQIDAWGNQILLNYRSYRSPQNFAPQVTLSEILAGQLRPDQVKDRIVLIGVTAQSFNDYWATPYSQGPQQKIPGVLIQAQMVSQLLSAVLDQRPLLGTWPLWGDILWIWSWSLLGSGLAVWGSHRSVRHLALAVSLAGGVLLTACWGLLIGGIWVPLVPSALALLAGSSSARAHRLSPTKLSQSLE
ncbi:CHASE2 domain-containing protein [Leptolyngbya sp. FACHB-261]|uniref:CHASE2 domain-containing protein n=1 Tax=Leptolyngbya sp. FACHB-261 TaxID=2692806 RepID=UPI00168243C6|nr:CHASE2 domain-containing protein [Leptolyngbya sp. FACHB-261]MBD2103157.1 CHASE2 domain-containing protein [Leptolyngbya sp. FACHB-261]